MFILKKNGKLRIYINYRQLNSIIKKDKYSLPLISEIQDRIGNAQIIIKIDLNRRTIRLGLRKVINKRQSLG